MINKPNQKQLEAIKFLQTQLKFWETTNDIKSYTHWTEIDEFVDNLNGMSLLERAKLSETARVMLENIVEI